MNASQCLVFRELSESLAYHLISTVKGTLCLIGAIRILVHWKKYGVRFLVHDNTKTMFNFYFALNIMIGFLFGYMHLAEVVRLRFDCMLLDFRYILLTRCFGICTIIASQHIILVLSFERLYSTIFPAHFEKHSSKIMATLLALITIIGTYSYGMMMLSDDLRLFKTPNSKLALLSANIPQNQDKFERFARNVALLNCVSFVTLTVDIYLNFFRKREKSSLAISYQRSENRRILLTLLPIELTQTISILFTSTSLFVFRTVFRNPTPIQKQLFLEIVTFTSCLPLIISFIIKYSVKKITYHSPPVNIQVDNINSLQQIWDDEFGKTRGA
ncbi:hypothetical protein PRIPAC_82276 [Pristionchus pacificus]|nr:hypothetical protein PRIPAC_82276 [Pristionchus pacificus]